MSDKEPNMHNCAALLDPYSGIQSKAADVSAQQLDQ